MQSSVDCLTTDDDADSRTDGSDLNLRLWVEATIPALTCAYLAEKYRLSSGSFSLI